MKWAWLKKAFGKRRFKSIDAVECVKDSYLVQTREKLEMEKEIINENQVRIQLAHNSPIFRRDNMQQIGQFGELSGAQNLIHHGIEIDTCNIELKNFFQFHQPNLISISTEIDTDRWKQHWLASKEKTASSMLRIHFGHYKVQAQSDLLSTVKFKLVNVAIRNLSLSKRWTKVMSFMLEKKPRVIDITKFRTILCIEAEFNGSNKIVSNTRLITTIERLYRIAKEVVG